MSATLQAFFLEKEEPAKGCLLTLRDLILQQDPEITSAWKYGMPFFCYRGKMCCYLWIQQKSGLPYIGFVEGNRLEHPQLITEKRARMKIFLCDPERDLPVETIVQLLTEALDLYRNGIVKIKR
jgi:hypothetical protein